MNNGNALVHELVRHHQCGNRNSKLTPRQAVRQPISLLQSVNVMEGEDYDRLRDLRCLEDFLHELDEMRRDGELERCGLRTRMRKEMVAAR